ncbi:MAG: hypothetical protein IKW14_05570 [Phascolarctobacterium sp.]|nr:hypothetical protein [Phascolarctobacterium sp.]
MRLTYRASWKLEDGKKVKDGGNFEIFAKYSERGLLGNLVEILEQEGFYADRYNACGGIVSEVRVHNQEEKREVKELYDYWKADWRTSKCC